MRRLLFFVLFFSFIIVSFSNTYKIGVYELPPLCFLSNGEPHGFYIDVLEDIAENNGWELEYQFHTFGKAYELLKNNKLDIVIAMAPTKEREQFVDFNKQPFMSSWGAVFSRKDKPYHTFLDLENKTVGLLKSGIYGKNFIEEMVLYNLQFTPRYFDSYEDILQAIDIQEIDAGVFNRFARQSWENIDDMSKPIITFSPTEIFFGFSKIRSAELIPAVDQYLSDMRQDEHSPYYKYVKKWLTFEEKQTVNYYFIFVLVVLIVFALTSSYLLFRLIKRLNLKMNDFKNLSEDFKTILNSIGDAVIWTDIDGFIEGMNPLASKLTGWNLDEAVGKPLKTIISIKEYFSKEELFIPIEKVIKEKRMYKIPEDTELISKNGNTLIIGNSIAPILDDSNTVKGIVVIFRDITQKRKNEMALNDSEKRFRTFVNSFPAIVFMKDTKLKNVFINQYVKENFIKDVNEWNGKTAEEIFTGDKGKKAMQGDIEALNSNLRISEETMLNKFGELRHLKTYKFPIEKKDGEKYLGGFSMDITEVKKIMVDLELAKKEAEKANKMKDIFLANINHEIRTPLNGVKGILDLFDRNGLNELQLEYLNMLDYSSDRLKQLVDDILDFSKINLDRIKLEKRPVKIDEICKVLKSEYTKAADEKGLFFDCKYHNPEINNVLMDPLRFEQILHNLLSNAIKFTDKGSVYLEGEYISMDSDKGILKISVSDTGIGMSEETVEKIFDYFYQGDQSYTKKFQGTGIGMALVKKLLDLMEGEIHINSTINEGTTYILTIPVDLNNEEQSVLVHSEKIKNDYHNSKFLIVEDDKINRLILKKALLKTGATIYEAENGNKALKIINDEKPNLIFMDIQMPDISGVDIIKRIRNSNDGINKTKIIAVSGYSQEREINDFLEAGADDFISKPIDNHKLFEVIKKLNLQGSE